MEIGSIRYDGWETMDAGRMLERGRFYMLSKAPARFRNGRFKRKARFGACALAERTTLRRHSAVCAHFPIREELRNDQARATGQVGQGRQDGFEDAGRQDCGHETDGRKIWIRRTTRGRSGGRKLDQTGHLATHAAGAACMWWPFPALLSLVGLTMSSVLTPPVSGCADGDA